MPKKFLAVIVVVSSFVIGAWSGSGSASNALPSGYRMVLVARGNARQVGKQCDDICHINGKWCPSGIWLCQTIDPSFGCIKNTACDCYNTCSQG